MLEYDFENSVGYWICTTSHALRRALEVELSQVGITLRQWEVLACLACERGMSQVEMAERLGIEPPTLAGVVRRMERDGWLDRRACVDDRRKNRIHPTQKADDVWKRTTEICLRIRQQAIAGLDADTLECLKRACEAIRENLSATAPSVAPAPHLEALVNHDDATCDSMAVKSEASVT